MTLKSISLKLVGLTILLPFFTSCVSLVTPEQAAIEIKGARPANVSITVADQRTNVSGGFHKAKYYGRTRMSYGIPQPILDPKMTVAERLAAQIEAGFRRSGVSARVVSTPFGGDPVSAIRSSGATSPVLVVKLEDVWIDFANPLFGQESILYFRASALVTDSSGKIRANHSRNFEKKFRYNPNDSFFNQAVWALQPEFSQLVNQPGIRAALSH